MSDLERLLVASDVDETHESAEPADEADSSENPRQAADAEREGLLVENVQSAVHFELQRREVSARDSYPYDLSCPNLVSRKSRTTAEALTDYSEYLFCLALSYRRFEYDRSTPEMFEELATVAAGAYLCGQALRFGSPRRTPMKSRFPLAVDQLCSRIGEGVEFDRLKGLDAGTGDGDLDLVAWRPSPDRRPGQVLLFGQCTVRRDWDESKPTELDPSSFCNLHFREPPRLVPVNSMFIPYALADDEWYRTRKWGNRLFFDRCRVAHWASQSRERDALRRRLTCWLRRRLLGLRAN